MASPGTLTTNNGNPVVDDDNSITAGPLGPIVLQDFALIDKLAHFDRERIPERVVHAKGGGAHGFFEVTKDITNICKAKFLSAVGKKTPVFARFSTVGGELGSADTARDPRGFAVKFYTEEGNWDMVGNNTPVFFIRDPTKFPDLIHVNKRNPRTHLKDPEALWDFYSLHPESNHQVTILFSPRGIPDGFRHMDGFSSHALKVVNAQGESQFVRFHFKTVQGIKNLKPAEAAQLAGTNPDYAIEDLFNAIERGDHPQWRVCIQVLDPSGIAKFKYNPFDLTKVWSQKEFPLIEIGRMVLNRNPENYFAEVEQVAFSPSHLVPGIEPSPDKVLQARLFSYPDTHRHRLGTNYTHIPINCPFATRVLNNYRDGAMCMGDNGGRSPNYFPNSKNGPVPDSSSSDTTKHEVSGCVARYPAEWKEQDDYVQAGNLYRLLSDEHRTELVENIAGSLKKASEPIRKRQIEIFKKCDIEYGTRVEAAVL